MLQRKTNKQDLPTRVVTSLTVISTHYSLAKLASEHKLC